MPPLIPAVGAGGLLNLNADSYVDEAQVEDWFARHPTESWTDENLDDLAQRWGLSARFAAEEARLEAERALARIATRAVDQEYPILCGGLVDSRQPLGFPQTPCFDDRGRDHSGKVPAQVQQAVFLLMDAAVTGEDLRAPVETGGGLLRSRVGDIDKTYRDRPQRARIFPQVEALLGQLVVPQDHGGDLVVTRVT